MSDNLTSRLQAHPVEQRVETLEIDVIGGPCVGQSFRTSGEEATIGSAANNTIVLEDSAISRFHATLSAAPNGICVTDCGSRNGTFVGDVRVDRGTVRSGTVLNVGRSRLRVSLGESRTIGLFDGQEIAGLYGASACMRRLLLEVSRVARSKAAVLISGETGTGKDVVARAIHELGGSGGPFVTVDCGAVSPNLLASELFGHERGAFTGADRPRKGAFELADGGTLFLDEIGELPIECQPALLGALERRCFRRVGGSTERHVDVRVLGATHRDLHRSVNEGTFRLDLFYRLAVVRLKVPPLRDRLSDVPELARRFANAFNERSNSDARLTDDQLATLQRKSWPGNVRELRNEVEALLVMGDMFPEWEASSASAPRPDSGNELPESLIQLPYHEARTAVVRQYELQALSYWLRESRGNVSLAARRMGLNRTHIYNLLARHGLKGG